VSPPARLLLDTHVFLWWRGEPSRLGSEAREAIANTQEVFVSAVSAWEAAIKASLGKLELPDSLSSGIKASGFEQLSITFAHVESTASLPFHHRDPFDRLLVAQAKLEQMTLVTHDRQLEAYGIDILWA
jgi:PIN domain nuclease of toxin-antitoxin system